MKSRTVILTLVFGALLMTGCSTINNLNPFNQRQQKPVACAGPMVNRAFDFYNDAKLQLAHHFKDRDSNRLLEAYYAASDSISTARSVASCQDKQREDYYAVQNLMDLNRNLQRIVRINMRDEDPGDLIALYRDQYDLLFENDIQ